MCVGGSVCVCVHLRVCFNLCVCTCACMAVSLFFVTNKRLQIDAHVQVKAMRLFTYTRVQHI